MFSIEMLMTSRRHNVGGDGRKGTEERRGEDADAAAAHGEHGDAAAAQGEHGDAEEDDAADATATADHEHVYEPDHADISTGEWS